MNHNESTNKTERKNDPASQVTFFVIFQKPSSFEIMYFYQGQGGKACLTD